VNLLSIELMAVSALMLTLLLLPASIRLAVVFNAMDVPDMRKVHHQIIPRLGGAAMAVAFLVVCAMFLSGQPKVDAFMVGAVVIVATGLADDLWQIQPAVKFFGEIAASTLFVVVGGVSLQDFGNLLGTGPILTGSFAIPVTVFCMVGLINAMNLSDGLDGLAGGLAAIACLFLGFFAFMGQQWVCLALGMGLLGCILAFLYYNAFPARVFMGDTGSLLLGYTLAAVAVLLVQGHEGLHSAPISMALILALPIVDTLLVMSRRVYYGYNPFSPDKTHLHHRLLSIGLPHAAVVGILYGIMAVFGLLAVGVRSQPEWLQFIIGLSLALLVYIPVLWLNYTGYRWPPAPERKETLFCGTGLFQCMTRWTGKTIPVVTWLVPTALLIPAFSLGHILTGNAMTVLVIGVMLLILFPWSASEDRLGNAHGIIYFAVFLLLAIYQTYGAAWVSGYLSDVSIVLMLWVTLKLIFKRHARIFLTSAFELLMLLMAWLVPMYLSQDPNITMEVREALLVACLESIPFLLAMKIIIRRQPRRNRMLAASLLSLILLVTVIGMA